MIRQVKLLTFGLFLSLPLSGMAEEIASFGGILHQLESLSPQLTASKAQAAAAKAGVAVTRSQYWGHIEAFAQDTHYNNARLVNPISPPINLTTAAIDKNQYGYGLMLTLPVDIDGRITASVNAQQHRKQAAEYNVASTRLSLFSQAALLYRSLQRLAGTRQALQSQQQALLKHRSITEAAIRVGRIARVELLRIDAEVKSVEGQIAALDGDEAKLRANMASLLNQHTFSESIELAYDQPSERTGAGVALLKARPDVQSAISLTQAEDENLTRARREWLPTFSVQAVTSRNQGYQAVGANTWSVTGQLSWQLWDGGRRSAHTDQALANREAARQKHLSIQNQARAELDAAKSAWKASALQYEAARAGLIAATEVEKIQSNRYQSGRLSAVDLLDAEAALSHARSSLSGAMANWWLADDQLNLAVGKEPVAYHKQLPHHLPTTGSTS